MKHDLFLNISSAVGGSVASIICLLVPYIRFCRCKSELSIALEEYNNAYEQVQERLRIIRP